MDKAIEPAGAGDLRTKAKDLATRARDFVIATDDDYKTAGAMLQLVVGLKKEIAAEYDPLAKSAHEHHMKITAARAAMLKDPEEAERVFKMKIAAYLKEEEKRRAANEARIQAEIKRQQEEAKLEQAQTFIDAGMTAEAEAVIDAPILPTPVALPQPKAAGISHRKAWKFEVTDFSKIRPEFLMVDEKKVQAIVNAAQKDAEKVVGGIRVWDEPVVSARAK